MIMCKQVTTDSLIIFMKVTFFLYRVHILAYLYTKPAYACRGGGISHYLYTDIIIREYRLAQLIAIIG